MKEHYEELVAQAENVMKRAYCPYSRFQVGAAILSQDGRIFTGCNVENASYGATICAERGAVMKGISEGMTVIKAIAIVSSAGGKTYPCGLCRQVLAEFMAPAGVLIFKDQNTIEEEDFWQLLPNAFTLKI